MNFSSVPRGTIEWSIDKVGRTARDGGAELCPAIKLRACSCSQNLQLGHARAISYSLLSDYGQPIPGSPGSHDLLERGRFLPLFTPAQDRLNKSL